MSKELLVILIIAVPVLGSFLMPIIGKVSTLLRNLVSLIFVLASLAGSLLLLPSVLHGEIISINFSLPLGFNFVLTADSLAVFMAIVSSLIGSIIVLYSFDYISHYDNQNEYYFMVVLFLGSMMGIVFSANLILLYVFWEMTAITSWRLDRVFQGKVITCSKPTNPSLSPFSARC